MPLAVKNRKTADCGFLRFCLMGQHPHTFIDFSLGNWDIGHAYVFWNHRSVFFNGTAERTFRNGIVDLFFQIGVSALFADDDRLAGVRILYGANDINLFAVVSLVVPGIHTLLFLLFCHRCAASSRLFDAIILDLTRISKRFSRKFQNYDFQKSRILIFTIQGKILHGGFGLFYALRKISRNCSCVSRYFGYNRIR